jgi:isochorismate hydrolase
MQELSQNLGKLLEERFISQRRELEQMNSQSVQKARQQQDAMKEQNLQVIKTLEDRIAQMEARINLLSTRAPGQTQTPYAQVVSVLHQPKLHQFQTAQGKTATDSAVSASATPKAVSGTSRKVNK